MSYSRISISVAVAVLCGLLAGSVRAQVSDTWSSQAASGQVPTAPVQPPTIAVPLFVDAVGYLAVDVPGMPGTQSGLDVRSRPIEVAVQLGTSDGEFVIEPARLRFEAGEFYKLIVTNPSNTTHYLSGRLFADNVNTRQLVVHDDNLNVIAIWREAKRWGFRNPVALHLATGIKVEPGDKAEWIFVAAHEGRFKFGCAISSHAMAGMVGEISVGG